MTKRMREKYQKQSDSLGRLRYPSGGEDVIKLCDAVDSLAWLLRRAQVDLSTVQKNEIERNLMTFLGEIS